MALKCEQGVISDHSDAVVLDGDQLLATCLNVDANTACTRIESILQQLFDD